MNWYWKVRITRPDGHYAIAQIKLDRRLKTIDDIQDFYFSLTANKMLLEGMSERPFDEVIDITEAFGILWEPRHS